MFALLPLTVLLAAPVPKDIRPLVNADPPKEWKLDEVAAVLPWPEVGTVRVLAWHVIDTKRGFILEAALVLKARELPADDGNNFALALMFRLPKAEKPGWQFASYTRTETKPNGVPIIAVTKGLRLTGEPPTNDEVATLLTELCWADKLQPSKTRTPELKAGGVVYANWKAALNRDPPPDLFPELKAK